MYKLPFRSVPQMLKTNAARFAGRPAVSYKKGGKWIVLSYDHLYERVLMAARGLRKAGVRPGDRVAILSENRAGWAIADLGIQAARAVTVPIYATNTPEQIEYVLNHAEAKIVFVSIRLQYENKFPASNWQSPTSSFWGRGNFPSTPFSSFRKFPTP
jgi:long-chain acyl-CoA synthetase